jgi:hypothetical protein
LLDAFRLETEQLETDFVTRNRFLSQAEEASDEFMAQNRHRMAVNWSSRFVAPQEALVSGLEDILIEKGIEI